MANDAGTGQLPHRPIDATEPRCPDCRSSTFVERDVFEHAPCGYVDFETLFRPDGGTDCPKCCDPIDSETGVRRGRIVACGECERVFDSLPRGTNR